MRRCAAAEAVARAEPAPACCATAGDGTGTRRRQPLPAPVEEPQRHWPSPSLPRCPGAAATETLTLPDALFALNSDVLRPTAKGSLDELVSKLEDRLRCVG